MVHRSKRTLSLSQHQCCVDMLEEFGMADCRPVSTPMAPGTHLNASMSPQTPADVEEMKDKPYMRAVGKLNCWPLQLAQISPTLFPSSLASTPILVHSTGRQSSARFVTSRAPSTTGSPMGLHLTPPTSSPTLMQTMLATLTRPSQPLAMLS